LTENGPRANLGNKRAPKFNYFNTIKKKSIPEYDFEHRGQTV
jgi:hypothetical protein